jgi:S-adenosylmethionine synthetase
MESVNKDVEGIMNNWLENIGKITEMMVEGKIRTF